jgi:hypothetical protein
MGYQITYERVWSKDKRKHNVSIKKSDIPKKGNIEYNPEVLRDLLYKEPLGKEISVVTKNLGIEEI